MPLTDLKIRNAKPRAKPYKLYDTLGLLAIVSPKGGKWWRFKYRFQGKEKSLSLGTYPDIDIATARERRDAARKQVAQGIDPSAHRQAMKLAQANLEANGFEVVGREWHAKFSPGWASAHGARVLQRLENDIFPWLRDRPIAEITAPELLSVIRRIETRGALESAHRALQICGQVIRYAISTARAERDVSQDLKGALPPARRAHFAAITDPEKVGALLRALDGYQGTFTVACALKIAPLAFVRPSELRQAKWEDVDLESGEWRFLVTKTEVQHIVPLSTQAIDVLRELHSLTGRGQFVFPSVRNPNEGRPMSGNTLLAAMRTLGAPKDTMTVHGFRAMARTLLAEQLGFRAELIEIQLAHNVRDSMGRAYNRTTFLPERKEMMQRWSDFLDQLKAERR